MRKGLTDRQIAKLPRKSRRYTLPDPVQPGLVLRIPPKGPVSLVAVARYPKGRQVWHTVGTTATHDIDEARVLARAVIHQGRAAARRADTAATTERGVGCCAVAREESRG
jgi:hypothetical protein